MPKRSHSKAYLLVLAAMAVSSLLYWPGLNGPFLFDDRFNFTIIQEWLAGQVSLTHAILGHQSLINARPVAMASFVLNAAIGGDEAFYFKLGNLIVHLLCGWLVWKVGRRAIQCDARLAPRADLLAAAVAALWLLHPLHVSTVLYAVQRMAQLSTLFTLMAVLAYLAARNGLATGGRLKPRLLLFVAFPLAMTAALLSKQNAATAPALCLLFELAYYLGQPGRGRTIPTFFGLSLVLPAIGACVLLVLQSESLLAGYADYEFTLAQRLLSEARALMGYVGQLVFPRTPLMGLYTDDFVSSTGLLSPPTTLLSILALSGISVGALLLRQRAPTFFMGWFFFLLAHMVESSVLPLDLYFEHRNYLPSVGLFLALAGLTALLPTNISTNVLSTRQLGFLLVGVLVAVMSFATLGRVLVWQDKKSIVEQGVRYHPNSLRAQLDLASLAYDNGHLALHDKVMNQLSHSANPRHRVVSELYLVSVACARSDNDPAHLKRAVDNARPQLTFSETHAFNILGIRSRNGCGAVSDEMIADTIVRIVDAAHAQPDDRQPKWLSRFAAANVYARAGKWDQALTQARLAWQPNADPGMGALVAKLYARKGDFEAAEATLIELGSRVKCHDDKNIKELGELWMEINQQRAVAREEPMRLPPTIPCKS